MGSVSEVEVTLPDNALPGADWADAYRVHTAPRFRTALEAGEAIIAAFPSWTYPLLALRQLLMLPFGLKGPKRASDRQTLGIFPIVAQMDDRLIAGFDDRHLDFRIVVDLDFLGDMQSVTLTTLIVRHNWLGRSYLQMVKPFHRMIIRSALSKLG